MECKNCPDAEKCGRKLELAIAGVTGWKCLHEFSLENVIEHLNTLMDRRVLSDEWTDMIGRAVELLKEQRPKTGRWISVPHKKARICNRCEADEPYKFADDDADVYDYCPHCGAKMVE